MRSVLALVRAAALEAMTYRVQQFGALVGIAVGIVPLYYVANALQPVMGASLANEGGHYFSFVVVGFACFPYVRTAISALPGEISKSISTGTLEAMIGTPATLPEVIGGMVGYPFIWTAVRSLSLLLFGTLMGVDIAWSRAPIAFSVLMLAVVAYGALGLFASSLIIAFRTAGPLQEGVIWLSMMLGGLYYPVDAAPSWLGRVTTLIPLTYTLRSIRRVLLEPDAPLSAIGRDVAILTVLSATMMAVALAAFLAALRYAKRSGTLAHY
jgi:ABC-2 type transport system permease protein